MNLNRITLLLLVVLHLGCWKVPVITPESQAEAEKAIDVGKARQISDSMAEDLIKKDQRAMREKMEKAAREYYDEKAFSKVVDGMLAMFGQPVSVEFKKHGIGRRTGAGNYDKPMRKFWYSVKTDKHEYGHVYLFVEIVPDENKLASSGFSLVTFPLGAPSDMQ